MLEFEKIIALEKIKSENNNTNIITLRSNCLNVLFDNEFVSLNAEIKIETLMNAVNEDSLFINRNFPKLKDILNNFYLLLYSKNLHTIKRAFYNLHNNVNLKQIILNTYDIYEEKLKYDYANKLAQFYTPDGTFVDKNGVKYSNVVDITNEDFFLNVHNIYIGFSFYNCSEEISQDPSKFIDKSFGNSKTISGTILSPDFISYVVGVHNREVLYGFNRLLKDDIVTVGNDDLNTQWKNPNKKPVVWNMPTLYGPNTLLNHVVYKYAESIIWRSTCGEKRKPDYILCLDNINKNSLMHAKYFNIPIYFIDSVKVLKNKLIKLTKEYEELINKRSPSLIAYTTFRDKLQSYSNQLYGLLELLYENKDYHEIKTDFMKLHEKVSKCFKSAILAYDCNNCEVEELQKQSILSDSFLY